MRSNKKLNRRERLQQVLSGGGLPNWLPDQEVFIFFQENDKQKYMTKGFDGQDVYLNEAAFDQLEAEIQKTGKEILLIKTERMKVLQKIVDEGRAMEAKKGEVATRADNQHVPKGNKLKTLSDIGIEPDPIPESTTTLFLNNQPTDAQLYFKRRAEAKRKTHF